MLLEIKDLKMHFPVQKSFVEKLFTKEREFVKAVDGVSFSIKRNEVFGLAGESGSGKTTIGKLILRLYEATSGKIIFDGKNIFEVSEEEMQRLRRRIQMIYQDPHASLNPRMKIGDAVKHPLEIHKIGEKEERVEKTLSILEKVGLTPPEVFYEKHPHKLSGGQRQRAVIARALILNPELIVADEPISMVDVSIRASILSLMENLKKEFNLTYLFITHDLATAKYICDRIGIMYLGKLMEVGKLRDVYKNPKHPYTKALLSAVPVPNPKIKKKEIILEGEIPSPINPPSGCRFHPRCPKVMEICKTKEPEFRNGVACHLYVE